MDQKFRKWYDEVYMPFMKDSSNIRKCDDCPNTDTCGRDICLVELECGIRAVDKLQNDA